MEPKDSLTISELYLSVQGEAAFAGHPCVMLRLTGCPLRCKWCDTVYSFKGGHVVDFETLEQQIEGFGIKTVEVTGGEPLAQRNIIPFMERLIQKSYTVMIETSGSEDISAISKGVHIIMDIKCPDSKMESKNLYSNLAYLKDSDEIKFVIASRNDFDWAVQFLREKSLFSKKHALLFSPAWGLVDPKDLVAWILETKLPIKLNLQWHKYIWSKNKRCLEMNHQNDELLSRLKSIEVQDATYHSKNPALVFDRAKGSVIWDVEGREYLDFCAGFGVQALGHNPDVIVNYLSTAFNSEQPPIVHGMGDVYSSKSKIEFCEILLSLLPKHLRRVSLSLGGGQAIEYAVKTAILKSKQSGFICFKGSYHGLDFAPLALTFKEWFKKDFAEWLPNKDSIQFLPYACTEEELENKILWMKKQTSGCAAILVEPIQGRSGCMIPPEGWLQMLRRITRNHGVLLIFDEIFVGMGRCGIWSHASLENCDADMVCFGKAIGASFPLSACVGSEEVMSAWPENKGEAIHTGTFFGHPLTCKLGALLLSEMSKNKTLFTDVIQKGNQLRSKLNSLTRTCSHIKEIRGIGLMNVIEYTEPNMGAVVMDSLRAQSIIALASGEFGQCIAFTPALNVEQKYFDTLVHALERAHLCL